MEKNNRLVAQTKAVIELNNMVIGNVGPVSSYVLGKFKELPVLEATFTLHLSNTYLDKELDLDQFVEEVLPDVTQPLVREKLEHTFPDITFKSVQILIISQGNIDSDGIEQDGIFYDINLVITISRKVKQEE
ncbi:hypothetical protein [Odoribacter sp. AF15-53]|uniref:hypothetical protein n=1 Tax=Odoribacter sp. AF15-53 TaxID=2292236 RepID=UPI000E481735|nr:hypothetical protein [Odoribacter sp. AF15-53]RHR75727.1 hypothetical protein DWW52_17250 [Odoribacter sp. AF15-53]